MRNSSLVVLLVAASIFMVATTDQPASVLEAVASQPQRYFGIHTNRLDAQGASEIGYIGANIVRTDVFARDVVEKAPGVYDFTTTDAAVKWAKDHNFELLGVLLYTPTWESGSMLAPEPSLKNDCGIPSAANLAGSYGEVRVLPPKYVSDYAHFVSQVVRRYPEVRYWQIWNEPNNPIFWQPTPDPKAYTALLRGAYIAAKSANPNAQVVLGGISLLDLPYIQKLYQYGAKDYFDIMAVHPYSPAQSPLQYFARDMKKLHLLMDRYKDSKTPIWVTEIGWYTGTGDNSVTEAQQADYVLRLYDAAYSSNRVEAVFWHALEDCTRDYDPREPEHNYGLFRYDYTRKPAADEYRALWKQ